MKEATRGSHAFPSSILLPSFYISRNAPDEMPLHVPMVRQSPSPITAPI